MADDLPPSPAPAAPVPPPSPLERPRRAWGRRLGRVAALAAGAALATGALMALGVATIWRTEAGTRFLLGHLPGITAVDVEGALGGPSLHVGSLRADEAGAQVDIADLRVQGMRLAWHPHPGVWLGVAMDRWDAASVRVRTQPSTTPSPPAGAPASLHSPVALDVAQARIGTLQVGTLAPLRDLQARIALGTEGGTLHRLDHVRFGWEKVQAEGRVLAHTEPPLQVDVLLNAHDVPDPAAPVPVAAAAAASGAAPAPLAHWGATATARGPLAALDVTASLRSQPLPGRPVPEADVAARVTPFAALPVHEFVVTTHDLDLSALSASAPTTRLDGRAHVATTTPAALDIDLRNAAPAAWSAGGLPVAAVNASLQAPWDGASIALPALEVQLADAGGAAGELRAQGRWAAGEARLQLELDQVQPARLDEALGAWRLSGPLTLTATHVPAPSALWGAAPAPAASSAARATPAAPAASGPAAVFAGWQARVSGQLAGTAPTVGSGKSAVTPPPMTLAIEARAQADRLELEKLVLRAGAANATATASIRRTPEARWQGTATATWSQLDPGAWVRLAASGPLRTGTTTLDGGLALELADAPPGWEGLAALRAKADLVLAPSLVGGLPLEGRATLSALAAPWTLAAELHSGGNTARADGTITPGRAGGDVLAVVDRLHLAVDAPALATLAPLGGGVLPAVSAAAPAASGASAPVPSAVASAVAAATAEPKTIPGELVAKAATKVATGGRTADTKALAPAVVPSAPAARRAAAGTWATRGRAVADVVVTSLRLGDGGARDAPPTTVVTTGALSDWAGPTTRLDRLEWTLHASTATDAPLSATLTVREAQMAGMRIARADADLAGTLAQHRLQLQADAPVAPPEWLAHVAQLGTAGATRLAAVVEGRWRPDAPDVRGWQGRLAQLDLQAQPLAALPMAPVKAGAPPPSASAASAPTFVPGDPGWIHVDPVDIVASRNAQGDWQAVRVGASHARVAGLDLAWQPATWTAPAARQASAHWNLDVALAPFSVAQVLARAQPDLGWHGDLRMQARLHAAFDGAWHVDGAVERTAGDLAVSDLPQDPTTARSALGLQAAAFTVKAEGLHWEARANVVGTRLGELSGTWAAEAPSPASLPTPASPLRGRLDAHVADLNTWGIWLPPGWRMGGEMRAALAFGGRWGDPQLTGTVTAQKLVVRNALEGVYAHDGDVAIRLLGDSAQIDRFVIYGGNGRLELAGRAALGAVPQAHLTATATQFQLLGRIDRRIVGSGSIALDLGADAMKVSGKLGIDEGLVDISKGEAPTLDSDVSIVDPNGTPTSSPGAEAADAANNPAPPKVERTTSIALDVDLGPSLHLRGRGLDAMLKGAIQVTAPAGQLAVRGAVHTEGGTYKAYGQNLQIARGEITFTGPVADPRLDILATRPNLDVMVGVAITGTAQAPHVRLVSEPEMSDADKLSWLMLGRAPEGLGSADTALLQQAAVALLAGEDEAPSDQLLKRLGLTDFSVGQQADSNNVKQTVVSLGRQLSKRWYVGYERGVNATNGSWQLIYRIAQQLTVRAQSGQDVATDTTGNSVDVLYTWRWN